MTEKTPQDYARELIEMYRANMTQPSTSPEAQNIEPPQNLTQQQDFEENSFDDGVGGLSVNVTTLRRLYPVKGATVTVFTGDINAKNVIETDVTDESGKSSVFKLKTPAKADSQQAENIGILPYASYNVSVRSDGYVEQIAMNVPVFSGVISVQGIDLVPVTAAGGHTNPQIIEGGNDYNL